MMKRALLHALASTCCVAMLGCVGPPSHFSLRSAASPEAPPASIASVGRALLEEPPLPGAATEGWSGLATTAGAPAHMHHEGMHHEGMDMSGMHMEGMDMSGMDMSGTQGTDMSGTQDMDMPDSGTRTHPAPAPTDAMPAMQGMKHAH